MLLSIVITSYRNPKLLKLCLDSILAEKLDFPYEIIVADSATEDDMEMMMREDYPGVVFLPFKDNVGFQKLIADGYKKSSGEFVLFLNGDILVTPGSIEKMLEYIKSNPDVGIMGPRLLNFNGSLQYSCFRFYKPQTIVYRRTFLGKLWFGKKHLDWFLMKDVNHDEIIDVDWLMGSALMVSRQAIEKVGLMDERFFMYMEDVDWCRRFWENGFRVVYFPKVQMHHYHGKGSAKGGLFRTLFLNRLTWTHIASALKYFAKYRGKKNPHIIITN